jgi:hypothetical protein
VEEAVVAEFGEPVVVGDGVEPDGTTWSVTAHGSPDDYYTLIRVDTPDGRSAEGGMGGPLLYQESAVNVYLGRSDFGPQRVVIRARPAVEQVAIHGDDGTIVVLPCLTRSTPGSVGVFGGVLPRSLAVREVVPLDGRGGVLAASAQPRAPRF